MTDAPDGFSPLFRTSPFLDAVGPFYYRRDGERLVIGLRVLEKHANARGAAHGGLLMTLADIALGYNTAYRENPPGSWVTANLTGDFAGAAKLACRPAEERQAARLRQRLPVGGGRAHPARQRRLRAQRRQADGVRAAIRRRRPRSGDPESCPRRACRRRAASPARRARPGPSSGS